MHLCRNAGDPTRVMIKIPKVKSTDASLFLLLQFYLFRCVTQPFFQLFSVFSCSWNRSESYVLHQLLYLQQSDRVPTNPSNLQWAQFYNTATKTLKSFNAALGVPLKRALWCTPNINRTPGSWQTRPVYRQRWGHPHRSSQNMHLLTGASQEKEKLNSSYSAFWRWCLSCCLDSKLCANIGLEKKNNPLYLSPLSLTLSHTHAHTAVMDNLFILRRICIHKTVSAPICLFTCCILWPNENKSIVPLGRDSSSLNHL